MLSLRYSTSWRLTGYLLLLLVLAAALVPPHWFRLHGLSSHIANLDKWLHGITFAVLALWFSGQYARHSYWRLVVGLAAFGLVLEVAQRTVSYRTADWMDLAADLAGVALGMAIALAGLGGWCLRFEDWLQYRGTASR